MTELPRRRLMDRLGSSPSLLAPRTRVVGDIETDGALLVNGSVTGDGRIGGELALSAGASWHGDIHARRAVVAGEGTALIERIGQLQSNAWLSARAMLKGGGAITDYESRKAEGAVARLSRAKSEAEFRKALKDLRDAITEGEAKLRGGGAAPSAPEAAPEATTP